MYSMVLMAAMATPADAEAFGKRGGCNGGCTGYVAGCTGCNGYSGGCSGYSYGCCGGTSYSYGCCGGSSCHGGRSGGFLGRRHKHSSNGCCGGYVPSGCCGGGYIPSGCCGGGYIPSSGCCGGVIIVQPAGKSTMPNPDTGKKPGGGAVKPDDGKGAFVPAPMPYGTSSVPAVVLPAVAPAPRGIRVE